MAHHRRGQGPHQPQPSGDKPGAGAPWHGAAGMSRQRGRAPARGGSGRALILGPAGAAALRYKDLPAVLHGFVVQGDQMGRIELVPKRGRVHALILGFRELDLELTLETAQEIERAFDGDLREVAHASPPVHNGTTGSGRERSRTACFTPRVHVLFTP